MMTTFDESSVQTVTHYLDQICLILAKLSQENEAERLLALKIAPDMFDTGFNFAIAIQFAARALCPPSGLEVPEIPEKFTPDTLNKYAVQVTELIVPISAGGLTNPVSHQAGNARLQQDPAEYVVTFALPNMIFHLTLAYAGLRQGGMLIGKADFDGFHVY